METSRTDPPIHVNTSRSSTRAASKFARQSQPPRGQRARGRRGESLASPRDRDRLRERNAAERARVEGILANSPVALERRARPRNESPAPVEPLRLRAVSTPTACPVCGDGRVVTDEVMHSGTLRMSECLHCEHRWTHRPRARWVELGARMNRNTGPRAFPSPIHGPEHGPKHGPEASPAPRTA